ncbi:MAG: aminotransferase class V-fold PLP-dependent enzyme [Tannerella sp.]|jgi:O-acetylhomoserine (thiol)-lyase|nr:aminotransferase class V-fold PLP-dependent enzyme [Tannerella sp.]
MNTQKDKEALSFQTKIIKAEYPKQDIHGALNIPVYRNAAFEFPDSKTMAEAFRYRTELHTYSRISNPTVTYLEEKIKQASGAENVIALASGMAAISNTFFTIASAGTNIVASPHLFGNTFSFLKSTLSDFGVEVRFVNTGNPDEIKSAIDENTCVFFTEIISNPHLEVANFPEISKILKENNIPMLVDTTLIPWSGYDASRLGIDLEVVSTTKYISGGATSIGGVIVDYGNYDWKTNRKLGALPKPKGMSRFMFKLRSEIARNLGACMAPDTAYMQSIGMDSLQLRYERMSSTAYELALYLSENPQIENVNYPKLQNSAYKNISDAFFSGNPGAMFTVNLRSRDACYAFMDKLQIIRRATNLFDNKTLVIHPESTIYATFSPEMKKVTGIGDNLLRFSVGLESPKDLIRDIEQALT